MSGAPKDYVEVKDRIVEFYEKFPDGSIQTEIVELTNERVTVKALAFRSHDDCRPGIGHSFMSIPGSTNFTRGSELENAETSAVGRAIAMLGFAVKTSIASAEEVAAKSSEGDKPKQATQRAETAEDGLSDRQRKMLLAKFREAGLEGQQRVALTFQITGKGSTKQLNSADMDKLLAALSDEAVVQRVKDEVRPEAVSE